jgi:hypothetical protein
MFAGPLVYGSIGTVAPTVDLTAIGSSVTAYYAGSSAGDLDEIDVIDVTDGKSSGNIFFNNGANQAAIGASVTLAGTSFGDTIIVDLFNASAGYTLSSDPADSADGENHAYMTPFTSLDSLAGVGAGGTGDYFVGMEDLTVPNSDLDYNDEDIVLTGVADPPSGISAEEPGSIVLLGTGILVAVGMIGRRAIGS